MASQQPEVTEVAEGDQPLSGSHPSTGEDVSDDSTQQRSEETSDIQQPVENGFLILPDGQASPTASFTYAFSPLTTNATPMDWKLLVTENVGCQNIRCHKLQSGDKLQELITGFQETNAKAVVLINTSDDYFLHPSIWAGTKKSSFPVLVLTKSDGMKLLNIVEQHERNMLAKISVESIVDRPVQMKKAENGSSSAPQGQDERSPFNLKTELKKLIFEGDKQQVICKDPGTFTMVMSTFTQYEKYAKPGNSHIDALKKINRHLSQTFAQDFPLYLVLAYKIHKKPDIYKCDECDVFMKNCTEKIENMDSQQVASTFLGFLQRGDFDVQFDSNNSTSAFQLLQEACFHMSRLSCSIMQKKVANASKQSEQQLYQRFVYSRFMWVSLYLRLDIKRDTENAENLWNCEVIKAIAHLTMESWMVAEVKKGLDFGQQVELPSNLTFSPLLLAKLFVSEGYARPFSHLSHCICTLESYISQEKDFTFFVTTMRAEYEDWLKQPGQKKFSASSVQKTLKGSIQEGLSFVDELYKFWTEHSFKSEIFDPECKKWVLLLLRLVDVTEERPEVHLKSFLGKSTLMVVKKYRDDITKHVIEHTYANFSRLSMQRFFSLYKAFLIWPSKFLEGYLHQYKVPRGVRISDPTWKELFSEVVKRFSGAQNHHYLLDFLESIAERYHQDGWAGDLVVDLLKLEVPKLFAVEGGGEKDEEVRHKFSRFLHNYIFRCNLKHTILKEMRKILDAISDQRDEFQQLVLMVVKKEMVPDFQTLQEKSIYSSPIYSALQLIVTSLCKNFSWFQTLSIRQQFCWGIVTSCCDKISITEEHFMWAYQYNSAITCLAGIYDLYCKWKGKPKSAEGCSQDIAHSSSDIRKYFAWINRVQAVLSERHQKFNQQLVNYDEILFYASHQLKLEKLCQTICASSPIVKDIQSMKSMFLTAFEELNILLIKYIPSKPDTKWCTLLSLLQDWGVALPSHLLDPIEQHVLLPGSGKAGELLETPLPPNTRGIFKPPGQDISLKLTKAFTLHNLCEVVGGLQRFLLPLLDVLDMLIFFKLYPSKIFKEYLQFYLRKESEAEIKEMCSAEEWEQHNTATITTSLHSPLPTLPSVTMQSHPDDQSSVRGIPLDVLLRAANHTRNLIMKLMEGTAAYSDIIAKGKLNLETLDIKRELSTLHGYAMHVKPPVSSCKGLAGVRSMLELFQYIHHIKTIHSVCEQYQLQGCLEDVELDELCTLVENLSSEESRARLTPLEASPKTKRVRDILCQASPSSLELFTAVGDSNAFYQFVREKQFVGEKGQAVFQQQYQLITAQLQHEEYNETVLNHLYAAFKIIELFMDRDQSFHQLMSQVTRLDVNNGLKQLKTVNTNITLIQLWFSRTEGDTLENVAKELDCIISTGNYLFQTPDTSSRGPELILEYSPSQQFTSLSQPSNQEDPELGMNKQRWNSEQIGDFVRKLGFLDSEQDGGDKIKHFLHVNEAAYKLLDLSVRLRELGNPEYIERMVNIFLNCAINREEADQKVRETEMTLIKWMDSVDKLRTKYDWLLFFSMPKLLLLYHLLQAEDPNLDAIMHEISFLCSNEPGDWEGIQVEVEKSLGSCYSYTELDKVPMDAVGTFLGMVFNNRSLPKRCGESVSQYYPPDLTQLLHYCPGYSQAQLICQIVSIYGGVPEPFEVFHCHPSSTEEELSLFLKRVSKHPLNYLILEVDRLPFRLQEYLMQLYQEREIGISSRTSCLHFVETAPSVLRKMPAVVLMEHVESGPSLNFEEARKICLSQVVKPKDFACLQLVYGRAGDGKTHYIKQQLANSPASLTIAVNEAFTSLNAISKLRTLPPNKEKCAIFFNFTVLPPGESVDESELVRHQQLMEVIGWFFFDLLMLGYVEDSNTGLSFCIPRRRAWAIYVEVPSHDHSMTPGEALKHFQQEVPTLGLLGTPHYIHPDTPYTVDEEVQLVCKYLKAFKVGGMIGIDRLYKEVGVYAKQPVKFSSQPNLMKEKCRKLLLEYMPDHVRKTKITQRLFIRYMSRRCKFLETLPAFNYNTGGGEYLTDEHGKRVFTDTTKLGSTLMTTMLREVKDFCDPAIKENWSLKPHQQLIYDFKDGGGSLGLISLHPENLPEEDKVKFKKIGVRIPFMAELYSRKLLDMYLSRALSVELEDGRLTAIDDSAYVLTMDYTIKMLNIHERYQCGVPVIIEGETGVGKTALLEMLSKLWNHALEMQWKRQCSQKLNLMREKLGTIFADVSDSYQVCARTMERLVAGEDVTEEDLILLGQLPDPTYGKGQFYCQLNSILLSMRSDPLVTLLILPESQQQKASLEQLFERAQTENSAESTASLLFGVLSAQIKPTFHKMNVHAAMTPDDIWNHLEPVFTQARKLKDAFEKKVADQRTLRVPFVTVFLDEVNTSSCVGLFKEIIVDGTFDGNPIPDNVFIVAVCNPHRGNSLASHSQETWVRGSYYVRQLHPTVRFLMWDYGSLDENQERAYINAKMKMLNRQMPEAEVASLTQLIVTSQNRMRHYAFRQLSLDRLDENQAKLSSRSCVSQRDIQRVFTFYQWVMDSYNEYKPYGEREDYSRRAVLVALGIVYYMRLNSQYRKDYEEYLDKQVRLPNEVRFSQAFSDELDWYIKHVELPTGIARTQALKENLFATIICTVTHTPLIIVGAPGSSKTLSFNLAIANLKGQESKEKHFRDITVFRSLDPHFYQCSRRTTSNEIQTVFSRAINRQRSHCKFKLPIYCVVFMDEAGLPEESHESLKVLHSHLDQKEVSFVAITNHVLDAAKTNRAVSLFRPEASNEDLKTLAKGCLCTTPDNPPPELKKDLEMIVRFCPAYSRLMTKPEFSQYFGLRDFIHFVSYLRRHRDQMLTPQLVMKGLERNFNGYNDFDMICNTFLDMIQSSTDKLQCRSILEVLKDSLEDRPQQEDRDMAEAEVRYKLIIDPSEDDSLVRLLFSFGVLQREETHMFMCSDFPGDSQLQKINTIAAILHSAIEGHTVLMAQTDGIHESFYDLFNQHFRRIDDPQEGARYYTNIAIGAHMKPSRVDPNFQCVVVIKRSEVKNTPAPFLNRFEKYCITHHSLLEAALSHLPACIRMIVETAMEKVKDFIHHISGPNSLYGLQPETLESLVLSLLPPLTHSYEPLKMTGVMDGPLKEPSVMDEPLKEPSVMDKPLNEPSVMDKPLNEPSVMDEPLKDPSVMDEPLKEPSVMDEPSKEPSMMDKPLKEPSMMDKPLKEPSMMDKPLKEPSMMDKPFKDNDMKMLLMKELLQSLHHCAGFCIPSYSPDELHFDINCLFDLVLSDPEFEHLFYSLTHSTAVQAVGEAMKVLHSAPVSKGGVIHLSPESCMVVALLEQWLVRYLCKRLMQLMTSEAFILYRNTLPSSYLENYILFQAHFSLKELILKYHHALEHSGWNQATSSPTKLLCFTRSTSLIHHLPAQYPSSICAQATKVAQQILSNLIFSDPSQLVVCKLSSLLSQSSLQEILKKFVRSNSAKVCLLVVNIQDTSRQVVNHLRIMIEEAELLSTQQPKLFVVLLHFPPAQFFDHCYPSLFLKGWDHYYLDTVAHSAVRRVVDIQDWFWQCCFTNEAPLPPKGDSLMLALEEIVLEAIPVLASRVSFGCSQKGLFNQPMNVSQRSDFLRKLLVTKGVGRILCEMFQSYWKPAVMIEFLEKAATFTKDHESTLNLTETVQTKVKSLFFDFLAYILFHINEDFNIDILFDSDCTPAIQKLFLGILRLLPLPKLSQLQVLSTRLVTPTPDYTTSFPFFKVVYKSVEKIVEQSHEEANVQLNLLQEEEARSTGGSSLHIYGNLKEAVTNRIKEKMESTPKEILVLVTKAMGSHPDLWQCYFDNFFLYKLRLGSNGAISQKILQAFFEELDKLEPMARVISLHCYSHTYHLNLAKIANILRQLDQIQHAFPHRLSILQVIKNWRREQPQRTPQTAKTEPSPVDPELEPSQQLVSAVHLTQNPMGTPKHIATFVVNTLFNAIVEVTIGNMAKVPEKMMVWFKVYRDVMTLSELKQQVYVALEPQENEGALVDTRMEVVEARLNVMQAVFLAIQTSPSLEEDILLKGQQIFQTLYSMHFTKTELRGPCPHLAEVILVTLKVISSTQFLLESFFAHFFSPYRHGYHTEDFQWFLELANKQEHLGANHAQHQLPNRESISNCMFKLYLGHILGLCDERDEVAALSGPLKLYHHKPRSQVGRVLMATPDLGSPAPYIPTFYQETSSIAPKANHKNKRMQQPLAHLYFLTCLEHLQAHEYELTGLVRIANSITEQCASNTTGEIEAVVLWVELQAVVQVLLQELATHLDPTKFQMGRFELLAKDINRLLDDTETGGGDTQGHGMVLALHLLKQLKSSHKFSELLTKKYESIYSFLHCLQPIHKQLTSPVELKSHILPFMLPGEERTELGALYSRVRTVMEGVHNNIVKVENLVHIAEECTQSLQIKEGSPSHTSTQNVAKSNVVDKRYCFRMMVWLCAYYDFYDKKVTSKPLCNVVGNQLAPYLGEEGCIRLIQCFLNPELMISHPESPKPLQDLVFGGSHRRLDREGKKIDHLYQLFTPNEHQPVEQSDRDLRHSLANLVGAVLGCPPNSNHLWYHLFHPEQLPGTYMTGYMYNFEIGHGGYRYDCGVELSPEGWFGRPDYVKHATRGTYTLHSLYLLLWANFGTLCMALLTQPRAEVAIHGHITSNWLSVRHYCVSQLRTIWMHIRNNLRLSDEERSFLAMHCTKKLYELFNSRATASKCQQGIFKTCQELDSYEKKWHTHIYQPSWSELKTEFARYSQLWPNKLFIDFRSLGLCYPHFPTEQDFIHSILSSGGIQSYSQGGNFYLLGHFVQEWRWLQAGGLLLPDLVEFYWWLHTALAHLVTYEQATTLPIGRVVELVVQRYDTEMGNHLKTLYSRVKKGYNQYVELIGGAIGAGACAALQQGNKIHTIADDIPLLHFLSDVADEEQGNDWLYTVAANIIAAHNAFIEGAYSAVQAEQQSPLARFLADEPSKVYPSEVSISNCIIGKFRYHHGISDFLQLVRSRYQPSSNNVSIEPQQHLSPSLLQTVKVAEFQLSLLQEDIVSCFLAGKPLICIEPSSVLRMPFKFRQSPSSEMEAGHATDVVGSVLDMDDIAEKIPDIFKVPLKETLRKRLEYEFHSASYHTILEVVIALKNAAGHLVKALMEHSSLSLGQQTVPQFMLTLYDHLKRNEDVLKEIGVHSTSPSQLACLVELPLTSLFYCLQLFASWIRDGVYDFATLPFGVKTNLSSQDQQLIQQIAHKWTGSRSDLLEEIKQIIEVLKHSETHILKTANESAHKPIIQYLQEIQLLGEEDHLPRYLPPSIFLQHYVSFRIALRRLALKVQKQVEIETIGGDADKQWKEIVWDSRLFHFQKGVYKDVHTGRYGLQVGSENDREDSLIHDFMNEPALASRTKEEGDGAGQPEDEDTQALEQNAEDYTPELVGQFLEEIGLGHHVAAFIEQEISGEMLLEPEEEMLEELEVTSPTERLKIKVLFQRSLQGGVVQHSLQEVLTFLEQNKLDKHCASFQKSGIDGDLLLEADDNVLKELGVSSAVERLKIKVLFQRSLQGGKVHYPLETVLTFLEQNKLDKYCAVFKEWGMDGDLLLEVDDGVLKEMGVNAVDRKKIKTKYKTFVKTQL